MSPTRLMMGAAALLALAGPAPAADTPVVPRERPDPRAVVPPPPPPPSTVPGLPRMVCGDRRATIAALERRHGETRRGIGLQSGNRVIEVFASESGSWTILLTDPSGRTCILGVGEAWTQFPPQVRGTDL